MLPIIKHPSHFISSELKDRIRNGSSDAEKLGQLHPNQLQIIYDQNWFNIFVPKEYGGLELNLVEALQIEESLAWVDGSVGWTVTLCAGANWFIGFLPPAVAKEIFSCKEVCFSGSGRPSGIAKMVNGVYMVSGSWKYATGAPQATIFTANCQIEENGQLLKDQNGDPLVRAFWFKQNEVSIRKDWNCMGMIATASHSFEVKQLSLPAERTFTIDSQHSFHSHPVYKYPFLQFAETTLAVNNSGMAISFLDLCESIFEERKGFSYSELKKSAEEKLRLAREELHQARISFYSIVERSWNELVLVGTVNPNLLDEISQASKTLAKLARQVVDELYPYCGIVAANRGTEINRVWRNIHTASQHSLLS